MWDYANLSKLAKENGGPEKLVESIFDSGKQAGKKESLPLIAVAAIGGFIVYAVGEKIIAKFKKKAELSEESMVAAKEELIQGIKDYDAEHDSEDTDSSEFTPPDTSEPHQ